MRERWYPVEIWSEGSGPRLGMSVEGLHRADGSLCLASRSRFSIGQRLRLRLSLGRGDAGVREVHGTVTGATFEPTRFFRWLLSVTLDRTAD